MQIISLRFLAVFICSLTLVACGNDEKESSPKDQDHKKKDSLRSRDQNGDKKGNLGGNGDGLTTLSLHSITPASGIFSGGTQLHFTGLGFSNTIQITIGGAVCAIDPSTVTVSELQCMTPPGKIGFPEIIITSSGGQILHDSSHFEYSPPPAPTIWVIHPPMGLMTGGTEVVIQGENFTPQTFFSVGGYYCEPIETPSKYQARCRTGRSLTSGKAAVIATNPDGTESSEAIHFVYQLSRFDVQPAPVQSSAGNKTPGATIQIPKTNRPRPQFSAYTGSEAETYRAAFDEKILTARCFDTFSFAGETIDISSYGNSENEYVAGYIIHKEFSFGKGSNRTILPAGTLIRQDDPRMMDEDANFTPFFYALNEKDAADRALLQNEKTVSFSPNAIPGPAFDVHPLSPDAQKYLDFIRTTISEKILELNRSTDHGYFRNAILGTQDGTIHLHIEPYIQRNVFLKILEAIRIDHEMDFMTNMIDFATMFDRDHAQAKTGAIDAFTYMFVAKKFPSEGTRKLYLHFTLRCGWLY